MRFARPLKSAWKVLPCSRSSPPLFSQYSAASAACGSTFGLAAGVGVAEPPQAGRIAAPAAAAPSSVRNDRRSTVRGGTASPILYPSHVAVEVRERLTLDDVLVVDADVHAHEQPEQMVEYVDRPWREALAHTAAV